MTDEAMFTEAERSASKHQNAGYNVGFDAGHTRGWSEGHAAAKAGYGAMIDRVRLVNMLVLGHVLTLGAFAMNVAAAIPGWAVHYWGAALALLAYGAAYFSEGLPLDSRNARRLAWASVYLTAAAWAVWVFAKLGG